MIRLYEDSDEQGFKLHVLSYLSGLHASESMAKIREIADREIDPVIRAKALDYVLDRQETLTVAHQMRSSDAAQPINPLKPRHMWFQLAKFWLTSLGSRIAGGGYRAERLTQILQRSSRGHIAAGRCEASERLMFGRDHTTHHRHPVEMYLQPKGITPTEDQF